jgi:DNA-binding FadR family transcriptional regulator
MRAHEAIYAAIAQGEVDTAREAMRQHILQSEADLRAALLAGPTASFEHFSASLGS